MNHIVNKTYLYILDIKIHYTRLHAIVNEHDVYNSEVLNQMVPTLNIVTISKEIFTYQSAFI